MTPEQRLVLAGWLSDRTGGAVEITSARRIGIGHSKEMWYLETHHGQRLVTRVDRGGVFATEIGDEARWMAARADTPVPVGERSTSPSAKMQTLRESASSERGGPVKMVP